LSRPIFFLPIGANSVFFVIIWDQAKALENKNQRNDEVPYHWINVLLAGHGIQCQEYGGGGGGGGVYYKSHHTLFINGMLNAMILFMLVHICTDPTDPQRRKKVYTCMCARTYGIVMKEKNNAKQWAGKCTTRSVARLPAKPCVCVCGWLRKSGIG
jgi:hypothetical protein